MGGLAGLGALAGGVAQGMERGQLMNARQQSMDANVKQQAEQDKLKADLAAADAAMAESMKGFETEHTKAQPSAMKNYLTLGGTDSSMPDQAGNDAPVAAASPFRPTEQQLLQVAQARTNKLFERGRHDQAVKQWVQDEGLRAQMRKRAVETGMMAFKAGGDIKPLLAGVYQTLDDGHDLGNVEQVNNPDPKAPAAWNVERVNQRTGEKAVTRIGADQIDGLVQFAMDPQQAARYSLMEKLAGFKGDQQRQTNTERGLMALDQIGERTDGNVRVAETRNKGAANVASIRKEGTITAADIRASSLASSGGRGGSGGGANGLHSVQKNADGTRTMMFRDGSHKLLVNDDGTPSMGLDAEKMLQSLTGQVSKSLDGLTATPEANRKRASGMLPKPTAPAQKPRLTLGDLPAAPGNGAADYSTLWK